LSNLLQARELVPLASRIRIHYRTTAASTPDLVHLLSHLITRAGNPTLMTDGLKQSVAEHACGNRRALIYLGDQLLEAALAEPTCQVLDEQLFARVTRPSLAGAGTASARSRTDR
jgi:general secretion pathway protein A